MSAESEKYRCSMWNNHEENSINVIIIAIIINNVAFVQMGTGGEKYQKEVR